MPHKHGGPFFGEAMNSKRSSAASLPSIISTRAVWLALIIIPINAYWLVISRQPYQYQSVPTIISPFFNVIFIIGVLLFLNLPLRRFAPQLALTQGELITIYILLSLTSAIQSFQMMQTLTTIMEVPFRHATPENEWRELFWRHIPSWLSVSDRNILDTYYKGDSTLYIDKHINSWLMPCLWWSAFVVVLVFVMICINVIVRRAWVENEKLSYPIIQLPLEMTDSTFAIFRNKGLWLGVGISGGVALINGLGWIFPTIPSIKWSPYYHNLGSYFTAKPWSVMGWIPTGVILPMVGLSFFMPLEMSFSCWIFYWFWKIQKVIVVAMGLQFVAGSYAVVQIQQSFGALLGIVLVALWSNWRYLVAVIKRILGDSRLDDSHEPMRYSTALLGTIGGIGFLTLFLWRAGLAVWIGITFFILYYLVSLGVTRIRAEFGAPFHDFVFTGPDQILPDVLGSRRFGARNLTVLTMLNFFNFTYRAHPMPHQIEGFALANRTRRGTSGLVIAMTLALIVGTLSFFWVYLHIAFESGGSSLERFANAGYVRLQNWMLNPSEFDYTGAGAIGVGFMFVLFFTVMRRLFLWFPFHPVGYAISNSHDINVFWFSVLIGFIAKWIVLKYGGLKLHRQARPFFLGLILGGYMVGGFWTIVGDIIHMRIFFGGSR